MRDASASFLDLVQGFGSREQFDFKKLVSMWEFLHEITVQIGR